MARLTNREQKLLRYPPTEKTWACPGTTLGVDGAKRACASANAGSQSGCWACGTRKPRKPKLLWPEYVSACRKAKIEPGTHWPPKAAVEAPAQPQRPRRRKRG